MTERPEETKGKVIFVDKNTSCSPLWRGTLAEGFSLIFFKMTNSMILKFDCNKTVLSSGPQFSETFTKLSSVFFMQGSSGHDHA
jgi:hypothetical protein